MKQDTPRMQVRDVKERCQLVLANGQIVGSLICSINISNPAAGPPDDGSRPNEWIGKSTVLAFAVSVTELAPRFV